MRKYFCMCKKSCANRYDLHRSAIVLKFRIDWDADPPVSYLCVWDTEVMAMNSEYKCKSCHIKSVPKSQSVSICPLTIKPVILLPTNHPIRGRHMVPLWWLHVYSNYFALRLAEILAIAWYRTMYLWFPARQTLMKTHLTLQQHIK